MVLDPSVQRFHSTLTGGRGGMEPGEITVPVGFAVDALPCTAPVTAG
ncbi:hypothetical protein ACWDSL_19770 [Streptomyces sp. NPDC000941]